MVYTSLLLLLISFTTDQVLSTAVVTRVGVSKEEMEALRRMAEIKPKAVVADWPRENVLVSQSILLVNKYLAIDRSAYCFHVGLDVLTRELPTYTYLATLWEDGHVLERVEFARLTWDEDNGVEVGSSVHSVSRPDLADTTTSHIRYDMVDGGCHGRAYHREADPASDWQWVPIEEPCS